MKITESIVRQIIREELIQIYSESEVHFYRDSQGRSMYVDDEGNRGSASKGAPVGSTMSYKDASSHAGGFRRGINRFHVEVDNQVVGALQALVHSTKSKFAQSLLDQVEAGRTLSVKQKAVARRMMQQVGMDDSVNLFV